MMYSIPVTRMGLFTIGSSSTTRAKTGVQIVSPGFYVKNYGDDYSVSFPILFLSLSLNRHLIVYIIKSKPFRFQCIRIQLGPMPV